MMIRKHLICLLWFVALSVLGQPYCNVRLFTLRDGLSSNVITSMGQTKDQLMWFSSWNGLSCYDGYTFTTFSDKMVHGRTLTTNRFLKISMSALGNVWCLTYDRQVFLFDRQACRFINVSEIVNRHYGKTFSCQRIVSLSNGYTWLLSRETNTPCFRINEHVALDDDAVQMYGNEKGQLKGWAVYGVELCENGHEWVLTDGGVTLVGTQVASRVPYQYVEQVGQRSFFATTDARMGVYDDAKKDIIPLPGVIRGMKHIGALGKLDKNQLVALTDLGLLTYATDKHTCQLIPLPDDISSSEMYVDKHHRVWIIGNHGSVLLIHPATGNVIRLSVAPLLLSLRQSTRNFVHEDSYGTIWIGTEDGFFGFYDEQARQFVSAQVRTNTAMPSIDRWFADSFGNLWFSGEHDMAVVNFGQHVFHHQVLNGMQQIRSICFDNQSRLWVGDITGHIALMDARHQLMGYLGADGKLHSQLTLFSNHIYCLYRDSQERMWIGTKGDGLYCLMPNGRLNHYLHVPDNPYSLCSNQIYAVHEDHQHRIWVGTFERGICLMQTQDGKDMFIHADNLLKNYPVNDYHKVRRITETHDGNIIVSASNGLVAFSEKFTSPSSIRFYAHKHIPSDTTSLLTSDVMQTCVGRDERIYVATVGGGMQEVVGGTPLRERLQMKVINSLDVDYGTILSMIEDQKGRLWIGRENSITLYDKGNGQQQRFGPANLGELVELTEAQPAFDSRTGMLVFATTSGYVCFHPESVGQGNNTLPLVIKSVYFHGSQESVHLLRGDSLDVPAGLRNFTVHFSALNYQDNYMIRYAYMLEGIDHDWNYLDNEHSISFSNLSHGHYRLLIRATNQYGTWGDNVKTLYIYVHPTFWESWIAKLLYVLLTIGIVAVAVWIYRLRMRASMERQLNNMKTQFFTDISHKLRTPLTLIGGPVTQVLEEEGGLTATARQHLQMVKRNSQRMLELVNRMLTYSKEHNTYISDENAGDKLWVDAKSTDEDNVPSSSATGNDVPRLRLLIVEDNDDLRAFLVSILSSDYSVIQAENGRKGLEKALQQQPDFILTDVMMPEMDGLEMVHRIKENPDTSHIPIVILSAKASLDDRIEGLKAGVNDYITKPFSATYLKQRMQNIISNQRLLQQSNLEHINQVVDDSQGENSQPTLQLRSISIVDSDKRMMENLLAYIEDHIADSELKIEDLAVAVNMGRTVFYNKVKAIVGMSPVELLRHIRIQHAEEMIAKSNEPFSQIAYAVGFSDSRYFGKCFKKQTGLTPSEYRERNVG
jgi:DNA-binding response OmpR family regulator/ligand-binding sensor domain-containing protein